MKLYPGDHNPNAAKKRPNIFPPTPASCSQCKNIPNNGNFICTICCKYICPTCFQYEAPPPKKEYDKNESMRRNWYCKGCRDQLAKLKEREEADARQADEEPD